MSQHLPCFIDSDVHQTLGPINGEWKIQNCRPFKHQSYRDVNVFWLEDIRPIYDHFPVNMCDGEMYNDN